MDASAILGGLVDTGSSIESNGQLSDSGQLGAEAESPVSEEDSKIEESKADEKKEEAKKPEDAFSKKFAALSRKEKQLKQREADIDRRIAELEAKSKPVEAPKAAVIPLEQRLKQNPLQALEELGLSYEMLTNLALNDGKMPIEKQMELMREDLESKYKSDLDELKSSLSEKEKQKEQENYNNTVQNFKNELSSFVSSSEEYELIQANDAVQTVYDVIEQHFKNSGKILSNKEASDLVESHLYEEAQKLLKLKKISASIKAAQAPSKQPEKKASSPTLTNGQATSMSKAIGGKRLSNEESLREAASVIKWGD